MGSGMGLLKKKQQLPLRNGQSLRRQREGISGREGEPAGQTSSSPSHSHSGRNPMAPVRYHTVPTMELTPCPRQLSPPPRPPLPSSQSSDSETPGTDRCRHDRCRHDRRHGRLNTELLNAVLEGNLAEVSKRLECGASVDATCRRSRTSALQLAVTLGHAEVAQLLLCRGAGVGVRDRVGRQAVHLAAATGRLLLLQLLLDSDPTVLDSTVCPGPEDAVDVHCLDSWSHDHTAISRKIPDLLKSATPLHLAVQRLHLDCVLELLQRGAKVDAVDARGLTPLDVLGEIPKSASTEELVDLDDTSDKTLARIENLKQRITGNPSLKPKVMKFNVLRDTTQNHLQTQNDVALPNAYQSNLPNSKTSPVYLPSAFNSSDPTIILTPKSVPNPNIPSLPLKIVSELIRKGAKMVRSKVILKQGAVQNQMTMPMTTLHTAVELQDTQLIECLLEHGACQLTWNNDGLTPLHLAVSKHLLESLRILLENNRSSKVVDARDTLGRTPLHLAVAENWFPGVSLLLEAGADVKVTSNDSQTVLHIAAAMSDPQLLEELLTIPESIKVIECRNNHHETPLCCAVSAGQPSCVSLLLSRGADITTCLPGDITLLHLAAARGSKSILDTLLADRHITQQVGFKNIRSKESKGGTTALHLAALGGYVDCVKVLLAAGCDVCAVTTDHPHYGSTALHLAALRGHLGVVESIINHDKGTMCAKNSNGWFPLHVAARFGHKDCASHMLLNGANLAATVYDSGGFKKTALDIIVFSITNPLLFLERNFDCCIEINEYPLHNPKCLIKVRYDILQPLGPHRKQMKVLDSLLNCGKMVVREKLLLHPLVETFLYLKWKKLRLFFFLMMLLYMILTVSLTTMAMLFYVVKAQSTAANDCVIVCRFMLCISLTLMTLQELMQASRMQRYYLKDLESWVKWSAFVLATVVVLGAHPAPWLAQVTAVAVLLSWLELLFLLSRWPSSLGFYILMFFSVAKNVLRVFATFTFVILGFTFAFMIQFEANDPFKTWWESLAKVLVMTLEFDYQSLNFDREGGFNIASVVGRAMFLSFIILVAIVLMNLLIGLAVSDIASLEKQGRAQRLAKQIEFLSLLELFVYTRGLSSCCSTKISESIKNFRATEPNLLIEPGKPLRKTKFILTQQCMNAVINNVITRQERKELVRGWSEESKEVIEDHSSENNDLSHPQSNNVSAVEMKLMESLDLIAQELADIKQQVFHLQQGTNNLTLQPENSQGKSLSTSIVW